MGSSTSRKEDKENKTGFERSEFVSGACVTLVAAAFECKLSA